VTFLLAMTAGASGGLVVFAIFALAAKLSIRRAQKRRVQRAAK
jgi:hypothetical protein